MAPTVSLLYITPMRSPPNGMTEDTSSPVAGGEPGSGAGVVQVTPWSAERVTYTRCCPEAGAICTQVAQSVPVESRSTTSVSVLAVLTSRGKPASGDHVPLAASKE